MVNSDQIGMHIVSIVGETTWKSKGTKHIQVFGVEDKRQISIAISSIANGYSTAFTFQFGKLNISLGQKYIFKTQIPR